MQEPVEPRREDDRVDPECRHSERLPHLAEPVPVAELVERGERVRHAAILTGPWLCLLRRLLTQAALQEQAARLCRAAAKGKEKGRPRTALIRLPAMKW